MKWFFFLLFPSMLWGQQQIVIPKEYSSSMASPWSFQKGDTLILEADSVYLISQKRYMFYRQLHQKAQSVSDTLCQVIVNSYEESIIEYDNEYKKLLELSKIQQLQSEELIANLESNLNNSESTLTNTQNLLEEARGDLDSAEDEIEKEKWNSAGKKIAIGASALGLGIVFGLLIGL